QRLLGPIPAVPAHRSADRHRVPEPAQLHPHLHLHGTVGDDVGRPAGLGLVPLHPAGLPLLDLQPGRGVHLRRVTVHFRDLSQVTPFISRMIFYTSGVFFELKTMVETINPALQPFADWQPSNNVLSIARGILMKDGVVPYDYFWHLAIWAFGIFIFGFIFFWQAEERYGRDE